MWLLVLTIAAAIVVVIVTRGDFRQLGQLKIAGAWLLFVGLAIQIALEFIDFNEEQMDTIGYGLLMASYAFILSFCFANIAIRGFGVIAVGVALNALVIGLNQGMPTVAIGNDADGNRVEKPVERTVKHRQEGDDDLLGDLGDKIVLPEPFDTAVSFGDLIMSVGICELAYYGTRRRRRRGAGARTQRVAQTRAGSTPRRSSTRSRAATTRPS